MDQYESEATKNWIPVSASKKQARKLAVSRESKGFKFEKPHRNMHSEQKSAFEQLMVRGLHNTPYTGMVQEDVQATSDGGQESSEDICTPPTSSTLSLDNESLTECLMGGDSVAEEAAPTGYARNLQIALEKKVRALEVRLEKLQSLNDELQEDYLLASREARENMSLLMELKSKNRREEIEVCNLRAENAYLQEEKKYLNSERVCTKVEREHLTKENQTLKETIAQQQYRIADLQDEVKGMGLGTTEKQSMESEIEMLRDRIEGVKHETRHALLDACEKMLHF